MPFNSMATSNTLDKAFADFTHTSTMPARSLEGDPDNVIKNTNPNILKRYVDGQLTDIDLWPWPYEDIIRQDMGMSQTITEYVREQLDPFIIIPETDINEKNMDIIRDDIISVYPNPFTPVTTIRWQLVPLSGSSWQ